MTGPGTRRLAVIAALVAIAALTFVLRLLPTYASVHDFGELIDDTDALFHLVRVEETIRRYPLVPVTTAYEEYPQGSVYETPPLYPFLVATPIKAASAFVELTPLGIRRLAAFWGPISGVLAVLAVYLFLGVFLESEPARLFGTLLYALMPIAVNYTSYGNLDYHGFIVAATVFFYAQVLRQRPLAAALSLVLLFGTWPASIFQAGIAFLALAALRLWGDDLGHLRSFEKALYGAAAGIAPLVLYSWMLGARELNPAWFGPGTLLTVLSLALLTGTLCHRSWWRLAASVALVLPLLPTVLLGVVTLYGHPIPFLETVLESTPLLFLHREFSLQGVVYLLTPLALATPVLLAIFAWSWRRNPSAPQVFLVVAYAVHASAALAMARYTNQLAPLVVLVLMLGLTRLRRARIPVALLLVVNAFPIIGATRPQAVRPEMQALQSSLPFWSATPATSGWGNPSVTPEYGVLTEWEFGIFIEYYAHRPVAIDARGPYGSNWDWQWVGRLLLADDEEESYRIAEERGLRYVLVRDFYPTLNIYPSWIGRPLTDYFAYSGAAARPTPALMVTTGFRLCELLGAPWSSDEVSVPALEHFRLVWLSRQEIEGGGHAYPWWFKIYEIVPGCRLRLPGPGRLTARLHLPNGASVPFQVDSDAEHVVTVPYPSTALSGVRLTVSDRSLPPVVIAEAMVRDGAEIDLRQNPHQRWGHEGM